MELFTYFIDLILHLDRHLASLIESYGLWTYLILFVIVFAETGLVVTPILPGDSLLFAAGTFAGRGSLNPLLLFAILSAAAILGDTINYWVGKYLGQHFVRGRGRRWIKQEHLDRTHAFFEKYGGKTIILARFVPFVRTFAPFVAGLGTMTYGRFLAYNVIGGLLWVGIFIAAGYFFGSRPIVQNNFSLVVLAIVIVSLIPAVVEYLRARSQAPLPP